MTWVLPGHAVDLSETRPATVLRVSGVATSRAVVPVGVLLDQDIHGRADVLTVSIKAIRAAFAHGAFTGLSHHHLGLLLTGLHVYAYSGFSTEARTIVELRICSLTRLTYRVLAGRPVLASTTAALP